MKKITSTLIFLTLFVSTLFAQQPTLKKIDSMLVNIDKSTLTTNTLYDRVTPYANLAIFNDSINVSNTGHFEQALFELHTQNTNKKLNQNTIFTKNTIFYQKRTNYKNVVNTSIAVNTKLKMCPKSYIMYDIGHFKKQVT